MWTDDMWYQLDPNKANQHWSTLTNWVVNMKAMLCGVMLFVISIRMDGLVWILGAPHSQHILGSCRLADAARRLATSCKHWVKDAISWRDGGLAGLNGWVGNISGRNQKAKSGRTYANDTTNAHTIWCDDVICKSLKPRLSYHTHAWILRVLSFVEILVG